MSDSTISDSNTPQRTTPQHSPLGNKSIHSNTQSTTRQSSHHENENNDLFGSEQNSPLSEPVVSDSGSDHELTRSRRVKRRIVESPIQDSSHSRSNGSITPTAQSPKNKDTNSEPPSENHLIKESPWEITEADTLKDNSDNEDIDLFGGIVSDDEEQFER